MLTPSSMIVYIEAFKDKQDGSRELFEAGRLTTLLHQNARMDKAGDIAALAKCHEMGWGCEKNYYEASRQYAIAQEAMGYPLYQADIERMEEYIIKSSPPNKMSFWKKLLQLMKMLFWPFD